MKRNLLLFVLGFGLLGPGLLGSAMATPKGLDAIIKKHFPEWRLRQPLTVIEMRAMSLDGELGANTNPFRVEYEAVLRFDPEIRLTAKDMFAFGLPTDTNDEGLILAPQEKAYFSLNQGWWFEQVGPDGDWTGIWAVIRPGDWPNSPVSVRYMVSHKYAKTKGYGSNAEALIAVGKFARALEKMKDKLR